MKRTYYISAWAISLLVGNIIWLVINGPNWFLHYVFISTFLSLIYLFSLLILDHYRLITKFTTVYLLKTIAFLIATAFVYYVRSTIPYFSFAVVPYYLCGMILLAFYETKEIEKKKHDQLNAE